MDCVTLHYCIGELQIDDMLRKLILVGLIQILWFQSYGQQTDLSQFIDASIYDGISPVDYQKLVFDWNMPGNIQLEMNEGLNAIDENQWFAAIAHFDNVLKIDSDFGPAYYYRGVCKKIQLNLSSAEYDILKAWRLTKIPDCLIELGDIYYLNRNFSKAKDTYQKASQANPNLVIAYYKLGCYYVNFRLIDKALGYFERCSKLDPHFIKAYLQMGLISMRYKKNNEVANQFFTKAIKVDSSSAQAYFWRGLLHLINRDNGKGLLDLNKTIEIAPVNPYFRLIRGLLLVDLTDFENAFIDLRRAMIGTQVSESKSQFGQTILDKKIDMQNAFAYLDRSLFGNDDLTVEFLKTGFCYLLAGNYSRALYSFNRANRLNQSACETYLIALTYEHMGKHNLAFEYYSKALLLDKDIFDAYKKRSIYRSEIKDWDGAFADLKEMRRLQPSSNVIYRLTGFLKYNSGDYDGSVKEMDFYLKVDSTDVEALKVRADSKSKVKDFSGAASDFKRIINLSEDKKDLEYLVITNTILAGDTINAIELLIEFNKSYNLLVSNVRLAELYIDSKDFRKAESNISHLEKTLKTSNFKSDMSFAYYLRSKLRLKLGQYVKALEQINKCLLLSNSDQFLFHRAIIYFQMNLIDEGRKDLGTLKKKGFKEAESFYLRHGID